MNENEETEAQRSHRAGIRSKLQLHSVMATAMLMNYNATYGPYGPSSRCEPEPPKRPCLNCGKEKQHNNAYCSSHCCHEHRDFMFLYGGGKPDFRTSSEQPNEANVSKDPNADA